MYAHLQQFFGRRHATISEHLIEVASMPYLDALTIKVWTDDFRITADLRTLSFYLPKQTTWKLNEMNGTIWNLSFFLMYYVQHVMVFFPSRRQTYIQEMI